MAGAAWTLKARQTPSRWQSLLRHRDDHPGNAATLAAVLPLMVQLMGQLAAIIQLRSGRYRAGASQPQEREARRITGIPALPVIERSAPPGY